MWCSHQLTHPDRAAHYCRSPYCGPCQRLKSEEESKLLRDHLRMLKDWKPTASFYHFCATAPDCQSGEIRKTLKELKTGWSRLIRKDVFKQHCVGWFLIFEVVVSKRDRTLENAHVHAVMVMAPSYSGRYYLNAEDWQQLWQECVDPAFFRSIEVHKRQNLDRLAAYLSKYNPAHPTAFLEPWLLGTQNPERMIERQTQVKGIRRYTAGGELKDLRAMPNDGGELTKFLYPSPNQWRRGTRAFARQVGYRPIPTEET